jgi:hypothetical protein
VLSRGLRWILCEPDCSGLALLDPDTVEQFLHIRTIQAVMLARLERPLPASWEE